MKNIFLPFSVTSLQSASEPTLHRNLTDKCRTVKYASGDEYLVPKNSSFIVADVQVIRHLAYRTCNDLTFGYLLLMTSGGSRKQKLRSDHHGPALAEQVGEAKENVGLFGYFKASFVSISATIVSTGMR